MVADISFYQAQRVERQWLKGGGSVSEAQLAQVGEELDQALALAGPHPDYLQAKARLVSWQILSGYISAESIDAGMTTARENLAMRPYWPNGWAEFALLKVLSGQVDSEFWQAFNHAQQLGPWEASVFTNLLNAGLGAWPALSWQQRTDVMGLLARAIHFDNNTARAAMAVVDAHGMNYAVCLVMKDSLPAVLVRTCRQ